MSRPTRPARLGTRGAARTQRRRRRDDSDEDIPKVYREMLAEAEARETGVRLSLESNRPNKRFKPVGYRDASGPGGLTQQAADDAVEAGGDGEKKPQVVYDSPSGDSDESDMEWEEVDIIQKSTPPGLPSGPISGIEDDTPLQITLDKQPDQKRRVVRRKPVTAAERKLRLDVHKTHLLCLMGHVQRRNLWCNDEEVQGFLKKMLSKHVISQLNPPENKPQHTRSGMFLDGLNQAADVFLRRFRVTKPGLRRAHWAQDADALKQKTAAMISEAEVFLDREDFRKQARALQGSRDFGAQLFCALLRSVAVEARLVCSLQPLPFSGMTRDVPVKPEPQAIVISSDDPDSLTDGQAKSDASPRPSPIRRLAQPSFKPARVRASPVGRPPIRESAYPIFWVEAFNEAFQKWIAIDPMVTKTLAKPHRLGPPATDPYNLLSYVVAFEEDASARDVTRRYTKAFNAKVRKNRVESTKNGEAWWERVLQRFEKPFLEDRDELEIGELTAKTASEPMPRNVQDFKDHPIYALERHLRRNEVIFPKRVTGHVSLGKPGAKGQGLEPIYRRSDVHILRSANKWYRLGRDIKMGEQPLKRIPAKNKTINLGDDEDDDMAEETALYAFFQTELYKSPPVVQGRVPKNAYGNLDVYVPSMVPPGGVHITHPEASRAARILGIDYADAVTGFNFKGRHGTAVLNGVVIADEYRDALVEVIRCLEDERLQNQQQKRAAEVLRLWKHFLLRLRIAERVRSYAVEGEEADDEASVGVGEDEPDAEHMGGGFLPESDGDIASPTGRQRPTASELTQMFEEQGGGFLPGPDERPASPADSQVEQPGFRGQITGKDVPDERLAGGFIPEDEPQTQATQILPSPRTVRSKYNLVVVARHGENESGANLANVKSSKHPTICDNPNRQGNSVEAPISVGSSAVDYSASETAEPPIVVDSSVNDSSGSIEMMSRGPSQSQSRAPSEAVEVLSQRSEDNEGSLLSEDPEDEDAVPEWLMSD
ncbi:putative DNA repair protein Rad4 [Aspergillus lucknowensis]|uniref:Rad4-domain-containing protein n=1 Tax=Aspergillus lucknowensis TaxID=176173 RepID=A0ABR4M276_9EURO